MKTLYLKTYRALAFAFLTGTTGTVLGFFVLMLFFMVNSSWIAPTQLSATSDKMLQFSGAFVQAEQNFETVKTTKYAGEKQLELAKSNYALWHGLVAKLSSNGGAINGFAQSKSKDIEASARLSDKLEAHNDDIDKALAAGVITQAEANQQRAGIQTFHNGVADGKISSAVAKLNVAMTLSQALSQERQAQADIMTRQDALASVSRIYDESKQGIDRLRSSAYFTAYSHGTANLAFIPYENLASAKVGNAVYDCALLVAACHQVGTIERVFNDEQTVDFPIFNVRFSRSMRGVLVSIKLNKGEDAAMHSKLLFFGGKPLLV